MDFQLVTGRPDTIDHLVFTTTFTHNNVFYKAALAETISWEGKLTGSYDALLQSGKGTQRLTLVKEGNHWRAGDEIEQIGIIQQDVVDLLGVVIGKVRRENILLQFAKSTPHEFFYAVERMSGLHRVSCEILIIENLTKSIVEIRMIALWQVI